MTAEQIACVPACEECGELWLPGAHARWQAYWGSPQPKVFNTFARLNANVPDTFLPS